MTGKVGFVGLGNMAGPMARNLLKAGVKLMGVYQLFAKDGVTRGGMMTKMPAMPVPCWGFYINAEAIDAAAARVTRAGGTIVNGPMEVPGGQWIVQCTDPQGAHFEIVAPSR